MTLDWRIGGTRVSLDYIQTHVSSQKIELSMQELLALKACILFLLRIKDIYFFIAILLMIPWLS